MYLEQPDPCCASGDTEQTLSVHPLISERLATGLQNNSHICLEETKVLLQGTTKHWTLFGVICRRKGEGSRGVARGRSIINASQATP